METYGWDIVKLEFFNPSSILLFLSTFSTNKRQTDKPLNIQSKVSDLYQTKVTFIVLIYYTLEPSLLFYNPNFPNKSAVHFCKQI